jgi:tetratricopeptide (TPR) repeat protein
MPADRTEALKQLLAADPRNVFARFGLAMEHAKAGQLEDAAREFATLLANNPEYWGAYFHYGQTLERLFRLDEARQVYERGIETAGRLGQAHARTELEAALDLLG